jgi:RNA polymerase sigma-70 factor (ECF subfamily)
VPQDDERQLIEQARRGDRGALGELYQRHVDAIYRYVHLRVGDAAVAEDLTAEVFLRALEGLKGYRYTGAPFVAWLYRIAYARTVDHWRRAGRRQEVALSDGIPTVDADPEVITDARRERAGLVAAVRRLTDAQQQVIILRFVEGMRLAEVAAVMHKTVGAVKALQHRALAALARLMDERERTAE